MGRRPACDRRMRCGCRGGHAQPAPGGRHPRAPHAATHARPHPLGPTESPARYPQGAIVLSRLHLDLGDEGHKTSRTSNCLMLARCVARMSSTRSMGAGRVLVWLLRLRDDVDIGQKGYRSLTQRLWSYSARLIP